MYPWNQMENGNGTWCNGGHGLNMTWLLKKVNRRRIDAFERWCWRRLLRTARIPNQELLDRINHGRHWKQESLSRSYCISAHIMWSQSLEKDIILGLVSGKRRRGRPRTRWLDTIRNDTGMTGRQLKEITWDRTTWRAMNHQVTKSRCWLNG